VGYLDIILPSRNRSRVWHCVTKELREAFRVETVVYFVDKRVWGSCRRLMSRDQPTPWRSEACSSFNGDPPRCINSKHLARNSSTAHKFQEDRHSWRIINIQTRPGYSIGLQTALPRNSCIRRDVPAQAAALPRKMGAQRLLGSGCSPGPQLDFLTPEDVSSQAINERFN